MKKKSKIILAIVLALVIIIITPLYLRYRSNVKLGEELRKEVDEWLASIPRIPESENGAPIINKALQYFDDFYDVFGYEYSNLDSEAVSATLRQYLAEKEDAFDLLEKGLAYKKWAYTTDYEKGHEATIPYLLSCKAVARLYILKGDIARKEESDSKAADEYLKVIRLADTFARDPVLITRMIFIAVNSKGLRHLLANVDNLALIPDDLFDVLKILTECHGRQGKTSPIYDTEYFSFCIMTSDMLVDGKSITISSIGPRITMPTLPRWLYDYHVDVEIFKKWRKTYIGAESDKYYALAPELKDGSLLFEKIGLPMQRSLNAFLAQMMIPNIGESLKTLVEHETLFRAAIAVYALYLFKSKNGSLPGSLDELGELVPKELLLDPFSGKNLIYRRERDDFYLYSTGYNGVDDGGKDKPVYEKDVCVSEVSDIVFHKPGAAGK